MLNSTYSPSGLVGLIMKCVYLDALSYEGDYSYNTVPMFTWITVEGTLVAIAASLPVVRPLVKQHLGSGWKRTQYSYDLPRYYNGGRSGHTGSSGIGGRLPHLRTSVAKGGGVSVSSPRSAASYGIRSLDGDDSDEGVLVGQLHQQEEEEETHKGGRGLVQAPQQKGSPNNAVRTNGAIMVRQEYTVTREENREEGAWSRREKARRGGVRGGHGTGGLQVHSEQSLEGVGLPRRPPSAWSRDG